MTQPDTGTSGGTGEGTLTQEQVNRLVAAERKRTEAKFADYEDLKKRAEQATAASTAQQSDVQKLTDSVKALTERAQKSEAMLARRTAAEKHKLPASFAKKLTSMTDEDADREAKELADELTALGVKLGGDASGGGGAADGQSAGEGTTTGGDAGAGTGTTQGGNAGGDGNTGLLRTGGGNAGGGRARENLRSGTTGTPAGGNAADEDPDKIAADIMSSGRIF